MLWVSPAISCVCTKFRRNPLSAAPEKTANFGIMNTIYSRATLVTYMAAITPGTMFMVLSL